MTKYISRSHYLTYKVKNNFCFMQQCKKSSLNTGSKIITLSVGKL